MLFSAGRILGAVSGALRPGWWALAYQIGIAFIAAYLVIATRVGAVPQRKDIELPGAIAVAGTIAFHVGLLVPSFLGFIAALVALWLVTTLLLERYLDMDSLGTQDLTQYIVLYTVVSWLIVGAVITVVAGVLSAS